MAPGTHTLWNFFIFFLFFTLMIGAVSVFGSTSFAVWGLIGAMVLYALLSTGVIDLATKFAVLRSKKGPVFSLSWSRIAKSLKVKDGSMIRASRTKSKTFNKRLALFPFR